MFLSIVEPKVSQNDKRTVTIDEALVRRGEEMIHWVQGVLKRKVEAA